MGEVKGSVGTVEFRNELFRLWPFAVVLILIIGGYVAAGFYYDYEHAKYATGEEYTVSATVDEMAREQRGTSGVPTYNYRIALATEEELPDGTHLYESDYAVDYNALGEVQEGDEIEITVSAKGYLKKGD